MTWFNLFGFSTDLKVVGRQEGAQVEFEPGYDPSLERYEKINDFFSYPEYWTLWENEKFFPDFDVQFHGKLVPGAKLTDIMSFSPNYMSCEFLIHDRVAELFSRFNFPLHKLYNVSIDQPGKPLNNSYKMFCCPYMDPTHIIDFDKSTFYAGFPIKEKKYLKIGSWEEYRNTKGIVSVEILTMSWIFDATLDFYHGRLGSTQFSQRLTAAMEQKGFTGFRLMDHREPKMRIL